MAAMHAKGELAIGEEFVHEGILGAVFQGKLLEETQLESGHPAVIPSITGQAWVTQCSQAQTPLLCANCPSPATPHNPCCVGGRGPHRPLPCRLHTGGYLGVSSLGQAYCY
jgi:hypothetical protein